tara:strand:- start:3276 stop:3722 length:447 start_codon:yes stop_codon:yes gene_type:complete
MAIKRDAPDKWFSDCVRERANWTCEYSGYIDVEAQMTGVSKFPDRLECAHIFGRRSRNVRYYPLNAVCLTHTSHRYFTENPVEFASFVNNLLGDGAVEILRERFNDLSIKYPKKEKKEISKHYRTEFRKMREQRKNGKLGRIDFIGYD